MVTPAQERVAHRATSEATHSIPYFGKGFSAASQASLTGILKLFPTSITITGITKHTFPVTKDQYGRDRTATAADCVTESSYRRGQDRPT